MEAKEQVYSVIKELTEKRIHNKRYPEHVLSIDVWKACTGIDKATFQEGVNDLVKEGRITYGKTINDIFLKITK